MGPARTLPKDKPKRSRPLRNPSKNQIFIRLPCLPKRGRQVAYPDSLDTPNLLIDRLLLGHFLAGVARKDLLTWFDGRIGVVYGHRHLTITYDN